MTSSTVDHVGIKRVVSAPSKMSSLAVDGISDVPISNANITDEDWKKFANRMQIFEPKLIHHLGQSCKPKFLRKFFYTTKPTRWLRQAAKMGKIDLVKVLLELGRTNVNKVDKAGQSALHHAAREGHLKIVNLLLAKKNIDANLQDGHGNTALHYAAKHGHVVICDMLLRASTKTKVDVNSINDSKETALVLAAGRGHKKIVDMLLKQSTEGHTSEDHESTPLHVATEHGYVDIVEKLPTENVNVNSTEDHKSTPFSPLHAAAEHGHEDIVKELLTKNEDVNSTDHKSKQSPLHLAVQGGHVIVVELFLGEPTVNSSLKDKSGNTPLHIAAKAGNGAIVEKLLQKLEVDDVISPNNKGMTALHLAAKYNHADIVTMLLAKEYVDPSAKTMEKDKTPLRMAAKFGGVDVVQVLLATGKVDVNMTDSKKRTAIRWASKRGQLNVVEELLRVRTVAPCLGDHNDDTPLHLAAKFGHKDIAERLLAVSDLDVNKVNKQNKTPLFLAAKHGFIDVVNLLLETPQVDLSICDHCGDSPFHVAIKGGPKNLVSDILFEQLTQDARTKPGAFGNFPIHYAAQSGNDRILQKILEAHEKDVNSVNGAPGVYVNNVNDHRDTALHVAVKAGHDKVVDILLEEPNVNASMQDRDGNSPLHVAALYDEEDMIEKLLKADGVDVNAKNEEGVTALVLAAKEGHELFVKKLLEVPNTLNSAKEGEKKASKIDWGARSLLLAARNGHEKTIKRLLACGVNVNGTHPSVHGTVPGKVQFRHDTALSEAIKHGRKKVVEELLKVPSNDPNRRNSRDEHPLLIAARGGHIEIVQKLLDTGLIDVNVVSRGKTALHGAAENGREQVVEILLKIPDIDVHSKSTVGETALFYAARADNKKILNDIYKASKANVGSEKCTVGTQLTVNYTNAQGDSIIHLAARENLLNVIDFLLEVIHDDATSVDLNLTTSPPKGEDGFMHQSALQIALDKGHYEVLEKLTKFESISFMHNDDARTTLQQLFDDRESWGVFNIVKKIPDVNDYIEALYKDRQAHIDAANAILVGAALIAGVTFASWLQPPLGYTTYYHEQFSDSLPAPPVAYPEYVAFDHHPSLQAFWVFNSLSFFSAIATVISGAQSVLPVKRLFIKQEVEKLRWNLLKTSILLGFSMFFVLLAFAIAGVIVLPPLMKFRSNIFSTIGIGGSLCFMFLFLFGKNIYELSLDIYLKKSQAKKVKISKQVR